ncbi:MAG: undecaprenyl-phosphate glucose phosphotransferase [Candidatus Eisenbacteria sp.]|nr:undecaprenyl-phosphate glucose phosphotransferase [Candidatus Eisenbacteria bacterium]
MQAKRSAIVLAWLPFLVDAGLIALAIRLSYWLRFESSLLATPKGTPPLEVHLPAFGFMFIVLLLSLHGFGLYRSRSGRAIRRELLEAFEAVTVGAVVGMAAAFLYRDVSFSRLLFLHLWLQLAVFVPAGRLAVRKVVEAAQRSGWGASRVALVGSGRMLWRLNRAVRGRPSLGYHVVGWVGEEDDPDRSPGTPYLGQMRDLRDICRSLGLDGILVALPLEAHEKLVQVIRQVDGLGVEVRLVPDLVQLMSQSAKVSEVGGIPLIVLREFPMRPVDRVVKRAVDIALSVIGLMVFSPVLAALGVLVRLESPGPVIYRQGRVGRDGRAFVMYKFRSMTADAEDVTGPVWAGEDDSRATRVGRYLRRLSLDELPQLVNVLKGEMSLVGPRPEREFFVRQFQTAVPRYLDRHRVKSGMTGWAQVHGLRGNTPIEERTEYDIYYAENWSVALDLRILWLTVVHLLSGGAARGDRPTKPLLATAPHDTVDRSKDVAGNPAIQESPVQVREGGCEVEG